MNRVEIGEKFKADILEAAHGISTGDRIEVKPPAPASKLYKECAIVKHELAQMGIDIEYENRDGGYAILTRWGVPARPAVEIEATFVESPLKPEPEWGVPARPVAPEELTNIPPKTTVEDLLSDDDESQE